MYHELIEMELTMHRQQRGSGLSVPQLITSFLVLTFALVLTPAANAQPFAIRHVRVFDGEQVHAGMTVVIRSGIIASVQADTVVPAGIEIIDGTGHTLLPGLFDSHGHMWGQALTQALAFGVTTVLDMFTHPDWAAERREEQRRGIATDRADLLSAGLLVTAPGGHGTQFGIVIPTITHPDEAALAVETRLAQGSDYIKIIFQPCENCNSVDSVTMQAVIAETHRRGRKAVVHVHTLDYGKAAIRAGADGIMHLFADQVADDDFLDLIVQSGAFVVPTLSVIAALSGRRDAGLLVAHPAFRQYLTAADVQNLIADIPSGPANRWFRWDSVTVSLKRLSDRGVPILAGSDPPNIGTAWGASVHRELELMVEAGMTPLMALRAATSTPARVFALTDRGRIATGLRADLLLVEGDPTSDIRATRDIVGIWKQGVRMDRDSYRETLAGRSP
jgi:imidazolonepropionase-like amidohydrolase